MPDIDLATPGTRASFYVVAASKACRMQMTVRAAFHMGLEA